MAPTDDNLSALLRERVAQAPNDPALISVGTGESTETWTWAELDAAVNALALGLIDADGARLLPGDRVALILGNRPQFVVSWFAVLRAGLVAVPLNTWTPAEVLAPLVTATGAKLILAEQATGPLARAVGTVTGVQVATQGAPSFDECLGSLSRFDGQSAPDIDGGERLAAILFTSGTGDSQHGAMLTHRALRADLTALGAVEGTPTRSDVVLIVVPMFHIYGLNAVLGMAVATGARSVLLETARYADGPEVMAAYGVTQVAAAPPMYAAWADQIGIRENTATVRTFASGALALPGEVAERFSEIAGKPVWEGYGMTETSPVVASTLVTGRPKVGSVGAPLPGVEIRLVDSGRIIDAAADGDEDATDDPLGQPADSDPGEVEVRGPILFSGYWPDGSDGPGADGWWATGDIGYQDAEGDLVLLDRRRERITVSGFTVYPREVEAALASIAGVAAVAVIGDPDPDPQRGEQITAYIVRDAGADLDAAAVIERAGAKLARFKVPSRVEFVAALPISTTGRVARTRLRGIPVLEGGSLAAPVESAGGADGVGAGAAESDVVGEVGAGTAGTDVAAEGAEGTSGTGGVAEGGEGTSGTGGVAEGGEGTSGTGGVAEGGEGTSGTGGVAEGGEGATSDG